MRNSGLTQTMNKAENILRMNFSEAVKDERARIEKTSSSAIAERPRCRVG